MLAEDRHCPCNAGFTSMQNARVTCPWRLLPRVQRKSWEARQGGLECTVFKAMLISSDINGDKGSQRYQKLLESLPRKLQVLSSLPNRKDMWDETSKTRGV